MDSLDFLSTSIGSVNLDDIIDPVSIVAPATTQETVSQEPAPATLPGPIEDVFGSVDQIDLLNPPSFSFPVKEIKVEDISLSFPDVSPVEAKTEIEEVATFSSSSQVPQGTVPQETVSQEEKYVVQNVAPFAAGPSPFSVPVASPSPFGAAPSPFSSGTPSPFSAPQAVTQAVTSVVPSPFGAAPSPFSSGTPSPFSAPQTVSQVASPFSTPPVVFSAPPATSSIPSPFTSGTPSPFSTPPMSGNAPSPFSSGTPSPFAAPQVVPQAVPQAAPTLTPPSGNVASPFNAPPTPFSTPYVANPYGSSSSNQHVSLVNPPSPVYAFNSQYMPVKKGSKTAKVSKKEEHPRMYLTEMVASACQRLAVPIAVGNAIVEKYAAPFEEIMSSADNVQIVTSVVRGNFGSLPSDDIFAGLTPTQCGILSFILLEKRAALAYLSKFSPTLATSPLNPWTYRAFCTSTSPYTTIVRCKIDEEELSIDLRRVFCYAFCLAYSGKENQSSIKYNNTIVSPTDILASHLFDINDKTYNFRINVNQGHNSILRGARLAVKTDNVDVYFNMIAHYARFVFGNEYRTHLNTAIYLTRGSDGNLYKECFE